MAVWNNGCFNFHKLKNTLVAPLCHPINNGHMMNNYLVNCMETAAKAENIITDSY